jgi:voltage-gated potassium channel
VNVATPWMDRHWRRSIGFSMALIGLVVAGIGAEWSFAVSTLATCAVGLGFFYLLFPGGLHFGITVANLLAFYACLFAFFHEANFADASPAFVDVAFLLPVMGFLGSCFVRRAHIAGIIEKRRSTRLLHLPRLTRWVPGIAAIGLASFAMPALGLDRFGQGLALTLSMAFVGGFVAIAVGDVVLLLMDIALVFEEVGRRLNRLLMPVMAFLSLYCLIVVVFGCLYRIVDLYSGQPQFAIAGSVSPIAFNDAVYFSVITLSTLGYGDIVPHGPLVRAMAATEVVMGVLMLLFGFSEIMRGAGRESDAAEGESDPEKIDEDRD